MAAALLSKKVGTVLTSGGSRYKFKLVDIPSVKPLSHLINFHINNIIYNDFLMSILSKLQEGYYEGVAALFKAMTEYDISGAFVYINDNFCLDGYTEYTYIPETEPLDK